MRTVSFSVSVPVSELSSSSGSSEQSSSPSSSASVGVGAAAATIATGEEVMVAILTVVDLTEDLTFDLAEVDEETVVVPK